jgi:hypothetical protein
MLGRRFHSRIGKVAALVAATLILPILAHAGACRTGTQSPPGPKSPPGPHPVVPEVNAAWVLIPVAGAVMLFSQRQFARRKG